MRAEVVVQFDENSPSTQKVLDAIVKMQKLNVPLPAHNHNTLVTEGGILKLQGPLLHKSSRPLGGLHASCSQKKNVFKGGNIY